MTRAARPLVSFLFGSLRVFLDFHDSRCLSTIQCILKIFVPTHAHFCPTVIIVSNWHELLWFTLSSWCFPLRHACIERSTTYVPDLFKNKIPIRFIPNKIHAQFHGAWSPLSLINQWNFISISIIHRVGRKQKAIHQAWWGLQPYTWQAAKERYKTKS